jgi:hypothetical protein
MTFGCSSPTARAHPGWAAGQKKRWYKHPGVRYDMNFEENLNQPEQNGFLFGFDILMCLRYPIQQCLPTKHCGTTNLFDIPK